MPRLRPLRTNEEINKVPLDKSVVVDLNDSSDFNERNKELETKKDGEKELNLGEPNTKPEGFLEEPDPFEKIVEPKKREAKKEEAEDDPTAGFKSQLDDMKKALAEANERAANAERLRQDAIKEARKREAEARQHSTRAEDAEYDAILNAISAAESDIERATVDLERAQTDGDHKAIADATRRMSRAESRLVQLEDGKASIEHNKLRNKDKKEPEYAQPEQLSVNDAIDQMPNLLPSQKAWLKEHPDVLTDQRKYQRLGAYHFEAEDKGLQPGTTKYFDYLNERLGYKEPDLGNEDDEDDEPPARRAAQAPPSRGSVSPDTGRQSTNRITLTPAQREAAAVAGVDPLTYAKNLQKLQGLKQEGYYNE